ncbi:nucleoside triphosphate pyrophosphohydrolase [Novosphingobium sp. 9U]|uniref:nucleoside triphosphate pyrophosphohydrolase n=1 Tax=Novosphingobium sp. 9U TaxID=2653158 RepID=UPI0012F26D82|nr:nucleoside triphosphate pyrophosphohydrolase [Novosphingobium sp. 9U]VWX51609.1 nucleoside triphosphate pyrophosphohydrolase [Novosphingobium sp. 9U]
MNEATSTQVGRLLTIMARLRDPANGCEWDRDQTYETIVPYTIEEAYEVADAIARADMVDLREELGDLLLQVVFHARMAEEAGHFAFADVAAAIADKLEARHPHIFGDDMSATAQTQRWETIKHAERSAKGATSALDGVALALPALMRAEKLQKRAARVGFDWPDAEGPKAKILEELDELAAAESDAERTMEAGDLLFSVVNYLRSQGIAPEDALRAGNAKFERRFRAMETLSQKDGREFAALTLEEQESYWRAAKASERGEAS